MSNISADKIKGVFSSQEIRKVGTGTTTRKTVAKTFWYAEEEENGKLSILPINSNYVPTGNKKYITKDELIERFSPEPEFYIQSVYPKMRELSETIDRADECREKGETFSAEFEYDNALQVDVENVRANFGIGLTYLARGETDKAENIFSRLVNLDAAFQEEHKHLFNDFGINLRKNKMFEQALEYYEKAEVLTKDDDNLYVNIARVYLEQKNIPKVLENLAKALELAPKNEIALKFLSWLEAKKLITSEQFKEIKPKTKETPPPPPQPVEEKPNPLESAGPSPLDGPNPLEARGSTAAAAAVVPPASKPEA